MNGKIVIMFDAEVTVELPASWRTKHYSDEQIDAVCKQIADNLGGDFLYKLEADEQ